MIELTFLNFIISIGKKRIFKRFVLRQWRSSRPRTFATT